MLIQILGIICCLFFLGIAVLVIFFGMCFLRASISVAFSIDGTQGMVDSRVGLRELLSGRVPDQGANIHVIHGLRGGIKDDGLVFYYHREFAYPTI